MATLRRSVGALSRRAMARIGVAAEVFHSLGYVADNELLGTRVAPLVRTALGSETTAPPLLANAHAPLEMRTITPTFAYVLSEE
jgi:hypothetical protein